MRTFVGAKLHRITVTDKSLGYNGSVAIDRRLMALVGIEPFEQVHVVNLNNGQRWVTYALPDDETPGKFSLNGGGARLGEIGDRCVVMTYRQEVVFTGAKVAFLDERNTVVDFNVYTDRLLSVEMQALAADLVAPSDAAHDHPHREDRESDRYLILQEISRQLDAMIARGDKVIAELQNLHLEGDRR